MLAGSLMQYWLEHKKGEGTNEMPSIRAVNQDVNTALVMF